MIQAARVDLSKLEESPWNVNVMPADKLEQLKADMKAAGPEGTDPIDTCVLGGKKYDADHLKQYKTVVRRGYGTTGKKLEEFEKEVTKLFERFGPKAPRGTKRPKSRKRAG
jgi:hypothetical protein